MSAWITGGAMVLSAVGSGIAANKASKAQNAATAANQAANDEANRVAWVNYLMSRGIKPKGNVQPGEIPTDYEAINSRLPLWANLTIPNPRGPNGLLPRTASAAAMGGQPASPAEPPRFAVPTLRRAGATPAAPAAPSTPGYPSYPVDGDPWGSDYYQR